MICAKYHMRWIKLREGKVKLCREFLGVLIPYTVKDNLLHRNSLDEVSHADIEKS